MHDLQLIEKLRNNESFTADDIMGLIHVHIVNRMGLEKSQPLGFAYNKEMGKFIKSNFEFMQRVSKMAFDKYGSSAFMNNLHKSISSKDMSYYKELYNELSS